MMTIVMLPLGREAHTQAIAGPREPGENGVKGWKWQRVDPALVGLAPWAVSTPGVHHGRAVGPVEDTENDGKSTC